MGGPTINIWNAINFSSLADMMQFSVAGFAYVLLNAEAVQFLQPSLGSLAYSELAGSSDFEVKLRAPSEEVETILRSIDRVTQMERAKHSAEIQYDSEVKHEIANTERDQLRRIVADAAI